MIWRDRGRLHVQGRGRGPDHRPGCADGRSRLPIIVAVGLVVGAFFAYLVTLGGPYFWEIVLPGSIVGLIVGFATAKYRGAGQKFHGLKPIMPHADR